MRGRTQRRSAMGRRRDESGGFRQCWLMRDGSAICLDRLRYDGKRILSGKQAKSRLASGESELKRVQDRPKQNVDPHQCAAQGECHYKNCPIEASLTDGLCNHGVGGVLVLGPYLIHLRHSATPSQTRARSIIAGGSTNLRILNNEEDIRITPSQWPEPCSPSNRPQQVRYAKSFKDFCDFSRR
jgi:hypothetical protein